MTGHFCHISHTRHAGTEHVPKSGCPRWEGLRMASDYRSADRELRLSFRVSTQEAADLRRQAVTEGFASVQQLLEFRVFGVAKPARKPGPSIQREELPMTG